MNNMMKRSGILAVLCVVLCMMLLVTACNGDKPVETTEPDVTTTEEVTTEEVTTEEVTTEEVTTEEVTTEGTTTEATTTEKQEETTAAPTQVTYTVTVKDREGNPIAGVTVQLCDGDRCLLPAVTGADGTVSFTDVAATYQATITEAVDGYVVDTAKKYDFAAGATALEIVLEAVVVTPPAPSIEIPADAVKITASVAQKKAELAAGGYVAYVYEALTDGEVTLGLVDGADASIVISNVTMGKVGFVIDGLGKITVSTKAGNTYLITVSAAAAETVEYYVNVADNGNGSKENPFVLNLGDVQHTVKVPAGETVYFVINDSYFKLDTPAVSVVIDGKPYYADETGVLTSEMIEAFESGKLVGIVGGAEDVTVTVNLTGTDEFHALPVWHTDVYEMEIPSDTTYYFMVSGNAWGCVLEDIVGDVTVTSWGRPVTGPVILSRRGVSSFAITNANRAPEDVAFTVALAPEGIDMNDPIELSNEDVIALVTARQQKISSTLWFTYTAAEYGIFKTDVPGAPYLLDGMYPDWVDLSVEGILMEPGQTLLFCLDFAALGYETFEDWYLWYQIDYVTVYANGPVVEVTVPAGVSYRVAVPYMMLMNGVYYEGIVGEGVDVTCYGMPVEPYTMFSMFGVSELILTNNTDAEQTVSVLLGEVPAGASNSKPVEIWGAEGTTGASDLAAKFGWSDGAIVIIPDDPMGDWQFIPGSVTYYTYYAETAGTFKLTLAEDQALNLDFSYAVDENWDYVWDLSTLATTGIEVKEGWQIYFAVIDTTEGAVEFNYELVVAE